jgi:hypothetical protein
MHSSCLIQSVYDGRTRPQRKPTRSPVTLGTNDAATTVRRSERGLSWMSCATAVTLIKMARVPFDAARDPPAICRRCPASFPTVLPNYPQSARTAAPLVMARFRRAKRFTRFLQCSASANCPKRATSFARSKDNNTRKSARSLLVPCYSPLTLISLS